jgi:excisionase family DNA binding protein
MEEQVSGRDQVLEALKEECASLSVEELAEVAGLPTWRVRAMAKKGKGPAHFKIGKLYRFPVVGVRAYFAGLVNGVATLAETK